MCVFPREFCTFAFDKSGGTTVRRSANGGQFVGAQGYGHQDMLAVKRLRI